MRFERLYLENFKSFADRTVIEFDDPDPTDKKNVILIGGMNGVGKTSVLEAINACLFGADLSFMSPRVNKGNRERGRNEIKLGLDLHMADGLRLEVRREWFVSAGSAGTRKPGSVLRVFMNGELRFSPDREDEWRAEIESLIPEGASKFFFFDGEKIQELASDTDHEDTLRDSIETVLGVELFKRLAGDLESLSRGLRRSATGGGSSEVLQAEARLAQAKEGRERIATELEDVRAELDELMQALADKEAELQRVYGGGSELLKRREQLLGERAALETELEAVRADLAVAAKNQLPFVPLLSRLTALRSLLRNERRLIEWEAVSRSGRDRLQAVAEHFCTPATPCCKERPAPGVRALIAERLVAAWDFAINERPEGLPSALMLGLSEEQERALETQIAERLAESRGQVGLLVQRRRRATASLRTLEAQVAGLMVDTSAEKRLSDKLLEIKNLNQAVGRRKEQQRELDRQEKDAIAGEREAEKALRLAEEAQVVAQQLRVRVDLAQRTRQAVLEFLESLRNSRTEELQKHTLTMYRRLASKGDMVREVRIDRQTYQVTLVGENGQDIPKSQLSAGEKEIYAVALLWGLAQSSRRDLPIIIDTPLARLDSMHREKIVSEYLPTASHQVIVLSTDTEIDRDFYRTLEPYVATANRLVFDKATGRTSVQPGYFWRLDGE